MRVPSQLRWAGRERTKIAVSKSRSTERSVSGGNCNRRRAGFVYDESVFRRLIAEDLRLAAGLDIIASETVAIGVGLSRIESLTERTGPSSWTYPFMGRGQDPLHLEPDSAVPTLALPRATNEIADEIVTRLRLRLRASQ